MPPVSSTPGAPPQEEMVSMVANYATSPMTGRTATGADFYIGPGSQRDSVTDAALIAFWAGNFTTTAPAAGVGTVTGVLAQYLAAYPKGP